MNLKPLFFILSMFTGMLNAQNFVAASVKNPKCFGDCDGTITLTTGVVVGPFTAVLTNSSSCPNSTVQVSSANSIRLLIKDEIYQMMQQHTVSH